MTKLRRVPRNRSDALRQSFRVLDLGRCRAFEVTGHPRYSDHSGGSLTTTRLQVGWNGGTSELRVRDLGSVALNFLNIGAVGSGVINQSGGTVEVTGDVDIQGTGTGTYNLSGGSLSVNGAIDGLTGIFNFTGGEITRSTPGTITFNGDLTTGTGLAALDLDNDKTFDINGAFNKTAGLTLELTGLVIPAWDGAGVDTGSFTLGTVNSIVGTFGPGTDTITGLSIANPFGATFINELDGEGGTFNPNTQSVYWLQESGGNVTLNYSVVPEPASAMLLTLGGLALGLRRRRS